MKSKTTGSFIPIFCSIILNSALIGLAIQVHAADKVRLGFSALSLANSAAWIAEEKGIFRKYDIEPELIVVGGGATRAVSAVMAGDLQFGTTGGGAAIIAALGGADVVMVAAGNNKGVQRLIVKPEIKTPEALKGKRIGVTALGSSGHLALLLIQRKWGQNPDDVQVVQLGSSPIMFISLQKTASTARFCKTRRFSWRKTPVSKPSQTPRRWTFNIYRTFSSHRALICGHIAMPRSDS